jgi:hypothetical protein
VYDVIERCYRVSRYPARDTVVFDNLDSAVAASAAMVGVPLFSLEKINPGEYYTIVTYAVLGKTLVEALHDKQIDLMYYWDYKRPSFRTEKIKGAQLLVKTRRR